MQIVSTYMVVMVSDMERATAFYRALGAEVRFASPFWTSLNVAGTAIGLHGGADATHREIGLGFDVDDIDAACAAVTAAGGTIATPPVAKPEEGITIAHAIDTEGNEFSITLAKPNEHT